MIGMISRFLARFKWSYVGTVEALAVVIEGDVELYRKRIFWTLSQRGDGKRKVSVVGSPDVYESEYVSVAHSHVNTWLSGGPIPPLMDKPPNAPPKKKQPFGRPTVIQGGKK